MDKEREEEEREGTAEGKGLEGGRRGKGRGKGREKGREGRERKGWKGNPLPRAKILATALDVVTCIR